MDELEHAPVMVREVVQALNVKADGKYLDATYGRGGHSRAILERLGPNARLIVIDRDPAAIAHAERRFADDHRVACRHAAFTDLAAIAEEFDVAGRLDGVLLDLGVSSPQLDDPRRGFGFLRDGPLDMRMNPDDPLDAARWLADVPEAELARVIRELGEERYARRVARAIVRGREQAPLQTTRQLAEIVAAAVPTREPRKHPATRTFQAIRMFINDELGQLRHALPQALRVLARGGRLVVISFHSLEDRIVKRFLRDESRGDIYPPDLPITAAALRPHLTLVSKALRPDEDEIRRNPRARSAVLRAAERTGVAYA